MKPEGKPRQSKSKATILTLAGLHLPECTRPFTAQIGHRDTHWPWGGKLALVYNTPTPVYIGNTGLWVRYYQIRSHFSLAITMFFLQLRNQRLREINMLKVMKLVITKSISGSRPAAQHGHSAAFAPRATGLSGSSLERQ